MATTIAIAPMTATVAPARLRSRAETRIQIAITKSVSREPGVAVHLDGSPSVLVAPPPRTDARTCPSCDIRVRAALIRGHIPRFDVAEAASEHGEQLAVN